MGHQNVDGCWENITYQQESQAGNGVLVLVLSILILPKERTLDPQDGGGDPLAQTHVEILFDIGLDEWADEIAWLRVRVSRVTARSGKGPG